MSQNFQDRALITEFSDRLHVQAQQVKSRLRDFVVIKALQGDLFAYDGLNEVEAREVNGRIVPTTFADIEHTRRKIKRRRFEVTLPIDKSDVRGSLLDYDGEYAAMTARAMERQFDRIGVEAVFADVSTGRDFENTVTFANDGGVTVNATAGLTYEKLLEITKNYRNEEVGSMPGDESMLFLITATEQEALMQEIELTSGDFSREFVVDQGEITRAAGHKLMIYGADKANPILFVSGGGIRDCVSLTGRGLCYGISMETSINIDPRPDFIETVQVQTVFQMGAVRTEGVLVQKVQTTS